MGNTAWEGKENFIKSDYNIKPFSISFLDDDALTPELQMHLNTSSHLLKSTSEKIY